MILDGTIHREKYFFVHHLMDVIMFLFV